MYFDIAASENWASVQPIEKGWSGDKKYLVTDRAGRRWGLRLSDIAGYDAKKKEYEILQKYAGLGISMSRPAAFGICNGGQSVYMLLDWVEGEDLETALPRMPVRQQYQLGRQAGAILQRIHSLPVDPADAPARDRRAKKLAQLKAYETSHLRVAGDEAAIGYVLENIDKIDGQRPVYQHGDFHPGNLICQPDGTIGVIDFNRWAVGDPYEEFYKLESFGVEVSVPYCIGQIDGYFADDIPPAFWQVLAVYAAHAALYSIKWAERFGQQEIDGMLRRCRAAFAHFDNFNTCVPAWYTDRYRRL